MSTHRSEDEGDALDSFRTEGHLLVELGARWNGSVNQRERGTLAKLVLEHAAVREAALEVLAERLHRVGDEDEAAALLDGCEHRRRLIADLDRRSQGEEPAAIAADEEVDRLVAGIFDVASGEGKLPAFAADLDAAVAPLRQELPSAASVRKHAPTRPGGHQPRWYDGLGIAARVHTSYDRMRGFPWPDSKPFMDEALAEEVDGA